MNVSREALIDEVQTLRARIEQAERERDEWQRKAGLNRADYLRVEKDRDKLEALAAGQAATIERVREWAEDKKNAQFALGYHARHVLSLLNSKESDGSQDG